MSSRNLVICDRESDYAASLAAFLTEKKELAFQVMVTTSLDQVRAIEKESSLDLLLISEDYTYEQRSAVRAWKRIVLTYEGHNPLGDDEISIFKYQSGDDIYAQIIQACAAEEAGNFLRIRKKQKGMLIGVYSPVHRVGQTSFALEKGKELAKEQNVLYLNLETYAGFGGHFQEEWKKNLTVLLYYAKQESENLGMILTTLVRQTGELDYILPAVFPEDIRSVTKEEWMWLFYEILKNSIYDVLILDLGECVQDLYDILNLCDTVFMPAADDRFAVSKIRQYEKILKQLGYEQLWERMIRCDTGRAAS